MHRSTLIRAALLAGVLLVALAAILSSGCSKEPTSPSSSDFGSQRGPSMEPSLARAMEVQDQHTGVLMAIPGVVGTGTSIGHDGLPVILALTRHEAVRGIPQRVGGVPVEVRVVGDVIAYGDTLRCGTSTGNDNECASGTIGCVVARGGTRYLLSCNHVFARENHASIGEQIDAPGRYDGKPKCAATPICGTLAAFKPISFTSDNVFDAAIVLPDPGRPYTCAEAGGYTPTSTAMDPYLGQLVKKSGRTTGLTHGSVQAIHVTLKVGYTTGLATFVDQIMISRNFIKSGDSGSLMVEESTNNPVGICFAGGGGASFANPVRPALEYFNATVCGQAALSIGAPGASGGSDDVGGLRRRAP
jgi:hypothetical protein